MVRELIIGDSLASRTAIQAVGLVFGYVVLLISVFIGHNNGAAEMILVEHYLSHLFSLRQCLCGRQFAQRLLDNRSSRDCKPNTPKILGHLSQKSTTRGQEYFSLAILYKILYIIRR